MADFTFFGQIARKLTSIGRSPDSGTPIAQLRAGAYREMATLSIIPGKQVLADEGAYFVATNPTIGTGVAYALQTSFSATAAFLALFNNNPASVGGGRNLYLDTLRLILTGTAPATTVSLEGAVVLDTKDRTPTANNARITPANVSGDDPADASNVVLQAFSAGAMTVPAAGGGARTVSRFHLATGLGITGDEYCVEFGGPQMQHGFMGLTAARATVPARIATHAPPVVIPPQTWGLVHLWWLTATTNAPNFEYELGFFVR